MHIERLPEPEEDTNTFKFCSELFRQRANVLQRLGKVMGSWETTWAVEEILIFREVEASRLENNSQRCKGRTC